MSSFKRALLGSVGAALTLTACGAPPAGETIGTVSSAITFPNDQPAFEYFVGKGLSPFQAAGIVGNLDQESGVDPTAVQGGGPGRGIAQWSVGGRWDTDTDDNATSYAAMQGQPLLSLQLQLDFIWYELMNFSGYGLADLQQTTNVSDATVVFETEFEGCGTCDQSTRIAYAQNVLSAFGGTTDGGTLLDASTSGDGDSEAATCTVTTTGESGECLDTSVCAAMSGHVSTPGYCPGPDDIQCCTGPADGTSDGGGPDAATAKPDSGPHGSARDSGPDARKDEDASQGGDAGEGLRDRPTASSSSGGGCSIVSADGAGWGDGCLVALMAFGQRRRRRRAA